MKYFNLSFKVSAALVLSLLLSACDEKPANIDPNSEVATTSNTKAAQAETENEAFRESTVEEEIDVAGTEALNAKLLSTLEGISRQQTATHEDSSKASLEQLSEADRQALIDITIESSSKKVGEDARKVLENSEPQ